MADRTVTVLLRADVAGFVRPLRQAQDQVAGFARQAQTQVGQVGAHVGGLGAQARQSVRGVGDLGRGVGDLGRQARTAGQDVAGFGARARGLADVADQAGLINTRMLGIAGAAALAGRAVSTFANFDQAMSAVAASTGESAEGMDRLREAAIQAGDSTAFSATEAAGAIEALAKAGVSTADILGGGLQGALDLAAAGNLDVGQAAEFAASAMTMFGLAGDDVTHIADLLAAGAGKAQGDVGDLGAALGQAGLVAAQTGLTIEETTGALAAFASAGLIGSDAGTSFKTMLQALSNPSEEAARLMRGLGIAAYDAQGQFVGLAPLAGQLRAALDHLTPAQRNAALATIFGSDAVRAAAVLYEEGAQGAADWTAAVNDTGYAAEQAATRLDNLRGDLEELGGALESLFIQTGEGTDGLLRQLTQATTGFVRFINEWNRVTDEQFRQTLRQGGFAEDTQNSLDLLTQAYWKLNDAALRVLGQDVPDRTRDIAEATEEAGDAADETADRTAGMGDAFASTAAHAESLDDQVKRLASELDALNGVTLASRDAARDYEAALDDAVEVFAERKRITAELAVAERELQSAESESDRERIHAEIARLNAELAEQSASLDITTEAGRRNQAALDAIARAAMEHAEAILAETGSEQQFRASLARSREALVATAHRFGLSKAEAEKYADEVLAIPDSAATRVSTPGLNSAFDRVKAYIEYVERNKNKTITATLRYIQEPVPVGPAASGYRFPSRQYGGYTPPGLTWVGEQGPELVRFERPAMVYTAEESARLMAMAADAGRGTTNNNTWRIGQVVAHDYEDFMRQMQRRQRLTAVGVS